MGTANAKATASFTMDKETEIIPIIPTILMKKMKVQKSKIFYHIFPKHPLRKF